MSRQFVNTWTKWTLDILYKNSHFLVTTGLNLMGFSANAGNELHSQYRKSYFDSLKTFEVIDAESPIVIFFWDIWYIMFPMH